MSSGVRPYKECHVRRVGSGLWAPELGLLWLLLLLDVATVVVVVVADTLLRVVVEEDAMGSVKEARGGQVVTTGHGAPCR